MHENYKDLIAKLLPDTHEREAFFACYHELLPRSIKIIEHKINKDDFMKYAHASDRSLRSPEFVKDNDSWYIDRKDDSLALGRHRMHMGGYFYIQEVAASLAAHSLDLQPGDIVLDMCAAPGGKSVQIADKLLTMSDERPGLIVSNEVSGSRIIALQSNLNRTTCYNSIVTQLDGTQFGNILPNFFDKILVDAPCSGEGTGFKSDASTKRRREENVMKIARIQYALLYSAIKACKPGGEIVYATCTLNPWENEGVLLKALQEFSEIIVLEPVEISGKSEGLTSFDDEMLLSPENAEKVARFRPHRQHTGGFFIAKIRKLSETASKKSKDTAIQKKSRLDISPALQKQITKILADDFGIITDPAKHFFASTNKQVYLVSPPYKQLHENLFAEKVGVPIFKRHSDSALHPVHGLGAALGHLATKNTLQLTAEECQRYSEGYDIPTDQSVSTPHKYAVLKREYSGFSVGKIIGDTIKNKFQK